MSSELFVSCEGDFRKSPDMKQNGGRHVPPAVEGMCAVSVGEAHPGSGWQVL